MTLRKISSPVPKRLRIIGVVIGLQLVLSTIMVCWWGYLLGNRDGNFNPTMRMIFWEGAWFLGVVIISSLFIFGLYTRDFKRVRALQAFFAALTHELKTPLTSIRLQAESIGEVNVSDAYLKRLIERLLQDTTRLEGEVERTLELARVEGGGRLLNQKIDLKSIVERTLSAWIPQHSNRMEINMQMTSGNIIGDIGAVQIILKNLLENSLRHGNLDKISVDLNADSNSDQLVMIYRDNGNGCSLDVKKLGKLFERGTGSSGAGVGLYLIRMLMRQMGGGVVFKSDRGFEASLIFRKGESLG